MVADMCMRSFISQPLLGSGRRYHYTTTSSCYSSFFSAFSSFSSFRTGFYYIAQDYLRLLIFLPPRPLQCCDHTASYILIIKISQQF